jgi:hypothetical protein
MGVGGGREVGAMTESKARTVQCHEHGPVEAAYVCRHLVRQLRDPSPERIGFFKPDAGVGETPDELQGWCGDCDAVLRRVGEWNDESEAFAGVTLICSGCYEKVRRSQSLH